MFLLCGAVQAQENDKDLSSLVEQWQQIDKKVLEAEKAFRAEQDADLKAGLRKQYVELVDQSKDLIEQVRDTATRSLDAKKLDARTSKILIGLVMNDSEFEQNIRASKLADKLIEAGIDDSLFVQAAKSNRLSVHSKEMFEEMHLRSQQKKLDTLPQVKMVTSKGELTIELFENEAPNTVANFISLIEKKFYNGLKFHRVVEGFVAQGGDPQGNGSGGPGYSIKCECEAIEARRHFYGSLSMAHTGIKDTGGSQFFICLERTSHLDGRHTVFGRVIGGIEVLDKLSRTFSDRGEIKGAECDTIEKMTVLRKREHEYALVKVGDELEAVDEEAPEQPDLKRAGSEKKEDGDTTSGESGTKEVDTPDKS